MNHGRSFMHARTAAVRTSLRGMRLDLAAPDALVVASDQGGFVFKLRQSGRPKRSER